MCIDLAKYRIGIQNNFWFILLGDVENACMWKENAHKNAQKVENFLVGMFN